MKKPTHPCGSNFIQSVFKTVQTRCIDTRQCPDPDCFICQARLKHSIHKTNAMVKVAITYGKNGQPVSQINLYSQAKITLYRCQLHTKINNLGLNNLS